ncbi:hypothetical protein SAMN05443639_12162 [Stigmatella erecta]|uniref:Uncharacterized protein n=1 Tax=Stigmatella erecta TaxID=83460 RepID=A0A1I0L8E5_9BACT|nr:hypothetical protein SAMN05443639_12162 [Stigmatella erecta]
MVGIGLAFLLLLPMALILGSLTNPLSSASPPTGRPVSPVLDAESRARLGTYHRRCKQSADCEPPLGCVADGRIGQIYCADSQCTTDLDCPSGLVCRNGSTLGKGPTVRLCIPVGPRPLGTRCTDTPANSQTACGPGLQCSGRNGWCGTACRPGVHEDCPSGFFCDPEATEPLCIPTCEAQGCPGGQQCIRYERGSSACATVYGRNCQQDSCPANQQCKMINDTGPLGKIWMDCVNQCGPGREECPEGLTCSIVFCRRPCDPQDSGACGTDFRCGQHSSNAPWFCGPDW